MIELYELRQFVAFAETGTLSEAAEFLHLSQPALSRTMKNLEDDFGVSLFKRSRNKLSLNANGEYVLELARKLLSDADSLSSKAREFDRKNRTINPWCLLSCSGMAAGSTYYKSFSTYVSSDRTGC